MQALKTFVDVAEMILVRLPLAVQSKFYDKYYDNSLKIVRTFGLVAGYVTTPNGEVSSFLKQAHDIGHARRVGYVAYDASYSRWISGAKTADLLNLREKENKSFCPDKMLLNKIQKEIDLRVGNVLPYKNVANFQ